MNCAKYLAAVFCLMIFVMPGATSAADTASPAITITCPSSGQVYKTSSMSISGTASDDVSVSKVEVKAGSGAWQSAAGTTSWSVPNLALANGLNTITARVTDSSGKTQTKTIQVNYNPSAVIKPAIGNVQKSNADPATQNNPKITYDLFADGRIDTLHRSSPVQTILEYYTDSWSWSPSAVQDRFDLARSKASKTDYLAFLMNEEIIQPSQSGWYGNWRFPKGYGGYSTSYGKQTFEGVSVDYGAGSAGFFLGMLKAWKQLCVNLGKKCALVGDAQSPNSFYNDMYGAAGVDYLAHNFDMIYLYAYPTSVSNAQCGGNGICAKSKIEFWRGKGFTGKINYIITTEQFGGNDAIVAADFKNAADAGADIISAYPYKRNGDTLATARMISIWDNYGGSSSAPPVCTASPSSCTNGVKDGGETGIDCGGPCPACDDPPSTTQLALKPGWNQISSSIAEGIDLATIESSCTVIQYKNQKIWSWNSEAQSWINPTKVEPIKGYWIYAAYVCTVPISGTPATFSSLQLYSGWNKVSASGALSAISGTCSGHIIGNWIWNWDKATEKWVHPTAMQLDKGYWIKVDADCVLGG